MTETKTEKIAAVKIQIHRAEGPSALCVPKVFEGRDCWAMSRSWLYSQAYTFPSKGGYDKHDFKVTWSDGEVYEGRLDCQHTSRSEPDLDVAAHIQGFVGFLAGIDRPAHIESEAKYQSTVDMLHKRGGTSREKYKAFLDKYSLGERGA